ncbi:M50 family metallopeptidase [Haloglycomyces albus]|uniref:M50 family metallopeptidase n=1 Tax=Haloglycomyces albus TaxID=526067 RepID=UPI00046D2D77|nr:M50 family metallopeptidase [Haloglycomyces albus]
MSALTSLRRSGLTVARVRNIPITIGFSWFILALLIIVLYGPVVRGTLLNVTLGQSYAYAAAFAVSLLVSVFLHEVAHAVTARAFAIEVRSITLDALGGATEMSRDAPKPLQSALIALAGPVMSVIIGLSFLIITSMNEPGSLTWLLVLQMSLANLLVAAYNLLPGLPLDGGKAIQALIWGITKDEWSGYRIAGWIGRGIAVATALAGLWLYVAAEFSLLGLVIVVLVGADLWRGAGGAIAYSRRGRLVQRLNVRELLRPIVSVDSDVTLEQAARTAQGRTIVVMNGSEPVGVVDDAAAAAVAPERIADIKLSGLLHPAAEMSTVDVDAQGQGLLRTLAEGTGDYYWVIDGERLVGVLHGDDVLARLNQRE